MGVAIKGIKAIDIACSNCHRMEPCSLDLGAGTSAAAMARLTALCEKCLVAIGVNAGPVPCNE